jgi:predicted SnoaL-like aldol condensation-catalyzing enzyme
MRNKDKTQAISKSIETGARHPLHWIDSRRYIQHNVMLGDGLGPLLEYFDTLPPGRSAVNPVRAIEDGDISLAHIEYRIEPYGHVVGFEIHRWEAGRIVEHWDNLQPIPDGTNPSGHTVLDGPTEVVDIDRTVANKELVADFVQEVLIGRSVRRLSHYLSDDSYIQHNPFWGDGAEQLIKLIGTQHGPTSVVHQQLHRVIGEGNFVATLSQGIVDNQDAAIFDMFRVASGRVTEHWDVIELIPARAEWKNDNGKF